MVAGVVLMSFPVSKPPLGETLTVPLLLDHVTLPVTLPAELPSVFVPKAVSCVVPPSGTVGDVGEIVSVPTCSGGKNPVQLTAKAKAASATKAPARRSFGFVDDIVI